MEDGPAAPGAFVADEQRDHAPTVSGCTPPSARRKEPATLLTNR